MRPDPVSRCGCSPAAPPVRRSGSTSPTTCWRTACSGPSTTGRSQTPTEAAQRRRDRQRAARAPRRRVPGAAVRHRGAAVRAARAVRPRQVGRRGAPAPATRGDPGARRAAHGARRRLSPRRPRQRPLGHVGHRAASTGRRRRLPARSSASPCSPRTPPPSSAAAWPAGTSPTTRSSGRPSGAAWARPRRRELRVVDDDGDPLGPDEAGAARGQAGPARPDGGLDPHHRPGPHRRRRLPVDPRPRRPGDHPRRVQGAARRRARRARAPPRRAGRGRGRPSRRAPRRGAGRRGRAAGDARPPTPTSCSSTCETGWPATRFPPRSRSSTPSPGRRRASPI